MEQAVPMQMDRAGGGHQSLTDKKNLYVKQTKKGWFQEMCGCDANTEFKIATIEDQNKDIYYATETTGCCIRFFCKGNRPFEINVHSGNNDAAPQILKYVRPLACPLSPCSCCCRQSMTTFDTAGVKLGETKEAFWMCVPSFNVHNATGDVKYTVHLPTCCGGMCINPCADGWCRCKVPYGIYAPGAEEPKDNVGGIAKVWGGMGKELFTDADSFETFFPADADADMKATLLGTVFLLNQIFFEGTPVSA